MIFFVNKPILIWFFINSTQLNSFVLFFSPGASFDGTDKWAFYDSMSFLREIIEAEMSVSPSTDGNDGDLNASTSQSYSTNHTSKRRTKSAHSAEIAPEQVLDQILNVDYDDDDLNLMHKFNAPANHHATATNSTDILLKLEKLDQKLEPLLNSNKLAGEPNYSFVISLLEMLRCIKDGNELAVLKGKIYKLIADSIATQK